MTLPYRRLRWFLAVLILLTFLVAAFWGAIYWRWALAPRALRSEGTSVSVVVERGMSPRSVGEMLEKNGTIRSAKVFAYLGRNTVITPGTYRFKSSESPAIILRRLQKGDIETVRVTFPEYFTVRRIAERLQEKALVTDPEPFLLLVTRQGTSLAAGFPLEANLEGYLFPDTYQFPVGSDPRQIAQRMLDNFARRVADGKKDEIRASGRSLHEIVTVASLIEREAVTAEDRPKIAGVIYNRLRKKMRLQIDATVQYALPEHKSRLRNSDLTVDSPYNTYKVADLPPGPICNPGLESIEAALHPETSEYLFYVAETNKKGHRFARTYAEHLRNIADIRR